MLQICKLYLLCSCSNISESRPLFGDSMSMAPTSPRHFCRVPGVIAEIIIVSNSTIQLNFKTISGTINWFGLGLKENIYVYS